MLSSKYTSIQKDAIWVYSNLFASSERLRAAAASKEFFNKSKEILVGSYPDLKIEVLTAYKNFFYCSNVVSVEAVLRDHEEVEPSELGHRNPALQLRRA